VIACNVRMLMTTIFRWRRKQYSPKSRTRPRASSGFTSEETVLISRMLVKQGNE
jgi:hypothetical protein